MELSWSTFFLEIVNFLVLVWILTRFLYRPVLQTIAQRKAAIDQSLSDAQSRHAEAQALERRYQTRLAEWESEKERLRAGVDEEMRARRAELLAGLDRSLEQEREKKRILEERRLRELEGGAQQSGVARGVEFTARLLTRAAGPELEARLLNLALEDLDALPPETLAALRGACRDVGGQVKVTSGFPLAEPQRRAIEQRLGAATQSEVAALYQEDKSLLAGLRLSIGPWVLRANLKDELEFFAQRINHDTTNRRQGD